MNSGVSRNHTKKEPETSPPLKGCRLCGNACGARRDLHEPTVCGAQREAEVSWWGLHQGEEPCLSGTTGCGNLFFHHCSMACVYCQNWQISSRGCQEVTPHSLTVGELVREMLRLQETGAATLGLVGCTPHLGSVVPALVEARKQGLSIPVVHNTGGFDTIQALKALEGLVDVYLPDMKYGSDSTARVYSGVRRYVETNQAAVLEMFRQVGHLQRDARGIARRGLLIRHLVLPGGLSDTELVLDWIRRHLSNRAHLSIMSQYNPAHEVIRGHYPELAEPLSREEYDYYLSIANGMGFQNVYIQDLSSRDTYNPDFTRGAPFRAGT